MELASSLESKPDESEVIALDEKALLAPPPTPTNHEPSKSICQEGPNTLIDFPRFRVAWKRNDVDTNNRPYEMSPEVTLAEFITTSASFHNIRWRTVQQLEEELRLVCLNNVMPANAAAWYMSKKRFYQNEPFELQLLPYVLKHHPKKFNYHPNRRSVDFLEVYDKEVAKRKMHYLVHQGLFAYFSHKADVYGVYFFDPLYYETTEPFYANLRIAAYRQNVDRGQLVRAYFNKYRDQFYFKQHSNALVSISKKEIERTTNSYGIIVAMINDNFGAIQFKSATGMTEKAIFSRKSLFIDGYPCELDPLHLPHIKFDGYKIPQGSKVPAEYTWYAVLVWSGLKPGPKFCSTLLTLESANLDSTSEDSAEISAKMKLNEGKESQIENKPDEFMKIGKVHKIFSYGAEIKSDTDGEVPKRFLIPGWSHKFLNKGGSYLTTTQGFLLSKGDMVAFRVDPETKAESFEGVGYNVMVLKHADEAKSLSYAEFLLKAEVDSDDSGDDEDFEPDSDDLEDDSEEEDSDVEVSEGEVKILEEEAEEPVKPVPELEPDDKIGKPKSLEALLKKASEAEIEKKISEGKNLEEDAQLVTDAPSNCVI